MSFRWPSKDPDEILDYSIDWSRVIDTNTISTVTWYVEDSSGVKTEIGNTETVNGLQRISATNTDTVTTIYLGLGTNNVDYRIYCKIVDSGTNIAERKVRLRIKEAF